MHPHFCPNPDCIHHLPSLTTSVGLWWIKIGCYPTQVVGMVQRYRCLSCERTFSDRTFSLDYYTKKTISYREVFTRISSGEWPSAMARNLHCSNNSIQNRIHRLGRNCLAAHEELVRQISLKEDLVADGFESFDRSQFYPNNINLLCGKLSQFLYSFTHSRMNRKGRMTDSQRRLSQILKRLDPVRRDALKQAFCRLLECIQVVWRQTRYPRLVLYTDEHSVYPGALIANPGVCQAMAKGQFSHVRISSKAPRTAWNPLFSVNYMDRELRKDIAAFHRESMCYTRNVCNGLHRLAVYQCWHNYWKVWRLNERVQYRTTHAEKAGLPKKAIDRVFDSVFSLRRFISQEQLSTEAQRIWLRLIPTPRKEGAEYLPAYVRRGYKQAS